MPTENKRYRVTIGMSVVPDGQPGFADFGLVYSDMPLKNVAEVEAIFNQHKNAVLGGMGSLIDALANIGLQLSGSDLAHMMTPQPAPGQTKR